ERAKQTSAKPVRKPPLRKLRPSAARRLRKPPPRGRPSVVRRLPLRPSLPNVPGRSRSFADAQDDDILSVTVRCPPSRPSRHPEQTITSSRADHHVIPKFQRHPERSEGSP